MEKTNPEKKIYSMKNEICANNSDFNMACSINTEEVTTKH